MTQQEQIKKAAEAIAPFSRMSQKREYFIKGAEWALSHQWISVEEALPEEEKKVLVTHQYGCQVAAFYKDGAHSYWGVAKDCPIGASITHWMAIPSLKRGEE